MKTKKKIIIISLGATVTLPVAALMVLYLIAMNTNLPGRRGGMQDAFRHTYSTALTARYLSPKVVELVTFICEDDPNSKYDRMDIHNNKIGTRLGLSEGPLYETVMKKIAAGQINAQTEDVVTWLPEKEWDQGL